MQHSAHLSSPRQMALSHRAFCCCSPSVKIVPPICQAPVKRLSHRTFRLISFLRRFFQAIPIPALPALRELRRKHVLNRQAKQKNILIKNTRHCFVWDSNPRMTEVIASPLLSKIAVSAFFKAMSRLLLTRCVLLWQSYCRKVTLLLE